MRLKNSVVKNNGLLYPDGSNQGGQTMNDNQDTRDEPNKLFIRLRNSNWVEKGRTQAGRDYAAASIMIDEHYTKEEITTAIKNYHETMKPCNPQQTRKR